MNEIKLQINKSFDKELKGLKSSGLKYLPWIGKDFEKIRLLIVGHSDYKHDELTDTDENRTRELIKYDLTDAVNEQGPLFLGLQKALGKNDTENDKLSLWNSCAFFNLSQKVLDSISSKRTWEDITDGWNLFFQISKVIKPEFCIFLGLDIATYIENGGLQTDETPIHGFLCKHVNDWKRDYTQISGNRPARLIMAGIDGQKLRMIFIKHPSDHFAASHWQDFIIEEAKYFNFQMP